MTQAAPMFNQPREKCSTQFELRNLTCSVLSPIGVGATIEAAPVFSQPREKCSTHFEMRNLACSAATTGVGTMTKAAAMIS